MNDAIDEIKEEVARLRSEVNSLKELVSVNLGQEVLVQTHDERYPSIAIVKREVARHFGLRIALLVSVCREQHIAWPRQVAMYLSYDLCSKSLKYVGQAFGNRDHGTVLHARNAVRNRMDVEPHTKQELDDLRNKVLKLVNP